MNLQCRHRRALLALALISACLLAAGDALAEADGPDFYRLDGVPPGGTLTIHAAPDEEATAVGELVFDSAGLANLGCEGAPELAAWLEMTETEREAARDNRWCRIDHQGVEGWVRGRYLVEDTETVAD